MTNSPKKYWDTSLFLCFLNQKEEKRRKICEDNLQHAKEGKLILYTSVWTIVEVIRPKQINLVAQKLTPEEISKIQGMFEWSWLKKIMVDEVVAKKAVALSRDYNLRPSDSIHAASAIINKVDALQKWDKDFDKIAHLLRIEEPTFLTKQRSLFENQDYKSIAPSPQDFVQSLALIDEPNLQDMEEKRDEK